MARIRVWRMHTGSAPGCQDTPRAIVRDWFGGEKPRLVDARACFENILENSTDTEADEEHRCFNRVEYELVLGDVKKIIRDLQREGRKIANRT